MGIFKSVNERQQESFERLCSENHIDEELFNEEDLEIIRDISNKFVGDDLNNFSAVLGRNADLNNIYSMLEPRLNTLIIQNFMIIKELKKLNNK